VARQAELEALQAHRPAGALSRGNLLQFKA
jgi:hypothetical protein